MVMLAELPMLLIGDSLVTGAPEAAERPPLAARARIPVPRHFIYHASAPCDSNIGTAILLRYPSEPRWRFTRRTRKCPAATPDCATKRIETRLKNRVD